MKWTNVKKAQLKHAQTQLNKTQYLTLQNSTSTNKNHNSTNTSNITESFAHRRPFVIIVCVQKRDRFSVSCKCLEPWSTARKPTLRQMGPPVRSSVHPNTQQNANSATRLAAWSEFTTHSGIRWSLSLGSNSPIHNCIAGLHPSSAVLSRTKSWMQTLRKLVNVIQNCQMPATLRIRWRLIIERSNRTYVR